MRKTFFYFILLAVLLSGTGAAAQDSGVGIGLVLGDPTGVSGKMWIAGNSAVDAAAAWSFGQTSAIHFHIDYLYHLLSLLKVPKGKLPFYFGVGGRVKLETDIRIGVRVPVGIAYIFETVPLDIFLEIAPIVDLYPGTAFTANACLGIRYFFGTGKSL